ncbi:hypothetical protein OAH05_02725 [bacterium]|jgi:hypothetical protein|nr:hypothetical protein [Planctomicrobium sp.]MDB4731906.1 hypothetical protein [bacterium]MDB4802824.1 hypothetical protein [bacterium]
MSPENADILVRWTARLVVVLYLWRCWIDYRCLHLADPYKSRRLARWVWTLSATLFVIHVCSALAFVHDFSHEHAYQHTAERTAAVVGVHWGGGIYVNHAFLIYWLMDASLWWGKGVNWPYRTRRSYWTMQSIFAFMFINATVVFGPAHWGGISIVLVMGIVLLTVLQKIK